MAIVRQNEFVLSTVTIAEDESREVSIRCARSENVDRRLQLSAARREILAPDIRSVLSVVPLVGLVFGRDNGQQKQSEAEEEQIHRDRFERWRERRHLYDAETTPEGKVEHITTCSNVFADRTIRQWFTRRPRRRRWTLVMLFLLAGENEFNEQNAQKDQRENEQKRR